MAHRFVEHTSDVIAECEAGDFPGLLRSTAEALYDVALEIVMPRADARRRIDLAAPTREDLLIRWLQELLFLLDVDRFVATRFEFDGTGALAIGATLTGYLCSPGDRAAEVKGATYHGVVVEDTPSGCRTRILFDL